MTARYSDAEVVYVVNECRLVDAESYERLYWRRDGKGLPRGHYVVRWARGTTDRRFNEDAIFAGPFASAEDARAALDADGELGGGGLLKPAAPARLPDTLATDFR